MAEARTQKNGQLLNPGRNLSTNWKTKSSNGDGDEGGASLFYMVNMRYLGSTQRGPERSEQIG